MTATAFVESWPRRVLSKVFMGSINRQIGVQLPQRREAAFPARDLDQVAQSFNNVKAKAKKDKAYLVNFAAYPLPQVVTGAGEQDPWSPVQRQQAATFGLLPSTIVNSQFLLQKQIQFCAGEVGQDRLPPILVRPQPDGGGQAVGGPLLKLRRSFQAKDPGGEQGRQTDGNRCVAVRPCISSNVLPERLIVVTNRNVVLILKQPREASARTAKVLEEV